jgi:aryl-alcohol dehydrogenase-like predicted oxidoreductase
MTDTTTPPIDRYALGTMTFGAETDEATARAQLDAFVEAGGTQIDTADVYSAGEAERILGRWLADRPDVDIVLTTKGRFAPPTGSAGASRRGIALAVERSLRRLGVDAIDCYLIHGWDQATPVAETLDALSAQVRAGRVHRIGWSNVTGWQLQRIITTARLSGHVVPDVLQAQYNLLDRGIELEVLPVCLEEGVGLTCWSPLGGGWLTGKYRRDQRPTGSTRLGEDPDRGVEAYDRRDVDTTWQILDVAGEVAERHGVPMGHVALAWLAGRPGVEQVIVGARTLEQLTDNLAAVDLDLPAADRDALTSASAAGIPPYPYEMIADICDVDHWQRLGTATG